MTEISDWLHSKRNRLFFSLRNRIRFQRKGYKEHNDFLSLEPEAMREIATSYKAKSLLSHLNKENGKKTLATLFYLQHFFSKEESERFKTILEVGGQDFSRYPAYRTFFSKSQITGIELDAFPILHNLHSRMDKANYYLSLFKASDNFICADFFQWTKKYDLILFFYPFVSENPALQWGLPKDYANPEKLISSIHKGLNNKGEALLVHQGDWEQEVFDKSLSKNPLLKLKSRKILDCIFYQNPHPAYFSLYEKI
ncbi:MAG: hypothetical protein M9962_10475 [Oligoflexia bacterium]|nr:hypothetical protein [Oligoflexia bacterium]